MTEFFEEELAVTTELPGTLVCVRLHFTSMTSSDIHEIVAALLRTQGLPVLGAKLGNLIRGALPSGSSLNIKRDFGSLRGMIEQCAGDLLQVVGKQGLDDIYDSPRSDAHAAQLSTPSTGNNISPWAVWHNPELKGDVLFDPRCERLVIARGEPDETAMFAFKRLSHEDQKAIIVDFAKAEEGNAEAFKLTLDAQPRHCWEPFCRALQATNLMTKWKQFRREKLRQLAIKEFAELGVSEEKANYVVDEAIDARHRQLLTNGKNAREAESSRQRVRRFTQLQELAAAAIRHVSEAELEHLNIPLGAVWKALRDSEAGR